MSKKKHLYFFTHAFPFESFAGNEIMALAKLYDKIFLFPAAEAKAMTITLPENVQIVQLSRKNFSSRLSLALSNAFLIARIFLLDLSKNTDKKGVMKNFRYNLSVLLSAIDDANELQKIVEKDDAEKRFVSFWMDKWSLILSILKYRKKIRTFVFRVHQHDLYVDGNPAKYIPFRYFNISMASGVFPDSKRGVQFLKNLSFHPHKMHVGHLGVVDKGTNPFDPSAFTLVSCSALIDRKRVEMIADALALVTIPVTWVHFGASGDAGAFERLKTKCATLPENISCELKGDVSYADLIRFYQDRPVSLFITLTRAEGLPVSVIEAVSFGIPSLVTDVMGLPDVVTEESGILIPPDIGLKEIASILTNFSSSEKNTIAFRSRTKDYWRNHFNSEINYSRFNSLLDQLASDEQR